MTDASRPRPSASRRVGRVVDAARLLEGGGFPVRRSIPTAGFDQLDPFLLLDHMGPVDWPPGEALGAPSHPHRGFETVTYLLEGEMEHRDSYGHHGVLRPGDVQWMTAGAGVVHSELPSEAFKQRGGVMHGFQLWVNLPRRDKMMQPRYQDIASERIPRASSGDGTVEARVVAGEALGAAAVIDTRIPIAFVHFTLRHGGTHMQPMPSNHTAFVYVFQGEACIGAEGTRVGEGQLALLEPNGEGVLFSAHGEAQLLLIAGEPLREPMARYGPFVMNTREEIMQAFEDFRAGKLGQPAT